MTDRLYYDNAYLVRFTAKVLECRTKEKGFCVRLDRSAFYPTSGGQPYDTGLLGGRHVLDVWVDAAGEVWHLTDGALEEGREVEGSIDWERRFDHMQQHAGEHMLAGVVWTKLRGHTIGLHLGAENSSIDVELPDGSMRVSEEIIEDIERTVNAQIQQDLPIRCWFPTAEEMAAAPLRKPPTVKEHIRLVQVGDVECVACGGTHPSSSGQIGLVKILDARPSRGKMRLTFVCGMRAYRDYQKKAALLDRAALVLSTGGENLPQAVEKLQERLRETEHALKMCRLEAALKETRALADSARQLPDGTKAVRAVLNGLDRDGLGEVAKTLTGGGMIALLASDAGEGAALLFAAPASVGIGMGALLSRVVKPLGGKGGGRPDFAQGAGPGEKTLDAAWDALMQM